MVDEAGKDHAALWKLSKAEDEEEAEQEWAIYLVNQILVKQSQNGIFQICTDVCKQVVLVVKLCLEESEFAWTCLIGKTYVAILLVQ